MGIVFKSTYKEGHIISYDTNIIKKDGSNISDDDFKLIQGFENEIGGLLYCDYIETDGVDGTPSRKIKIESKTLTVGAPGITIVIGDYVE